jgi:hypothetical protein
MMPLDDNTTIEHLDFDARCEWHLYKGTEIAATFAVECRNCGHIEVRCTACAKYMITTARVKLAICPTCSNTGSINQTMTIRALVVIP